MNTIRNERHNLGSAFKKLIDSSFYYHKGFRAERLSGGRCVYEGKIFNDISKWKDYIDNYIKEQAQGIQNSIKKV